MRPTLLCEGQDTPKTMHINKDINILKDIFRTQVMKKYKVCHMMSNRKNWIA